MAQGEQTVVGGATLRNEIERDFPWVKRDCEEGWAAQDNSDSFLVESPVAFEHNAD